MDLISREAALDCFHDWIDRHGDVHTPDEMAEYIAIEALPFVESEKRTEELTETHACDLISRLSEIRSQYNCFNESEEPYYRALSEVIKKLSEQADGDTISRQAAIDAVDNTKEVKK